MGKLEYNPRRRRKAAALWLSLALLWPPVHTTASTEDAASRIQHAVSYLSSVGSRVAGYPGCDLTAAFVEQQFLSIGLEQIEREPFNIVVPVDHGSHLELRASAERFQLHALWPNSVRTTTIAPPGHSGELIYGGTGTWTELNGYELEGSVVLLEFNSADRWLEMAALGARAIVFIAPEATSSRQALEKFSMAPLDVPRFWINRPDGIELRRRLTATQAGGTRRSLPIRLYSRMDWEQRQTWNIVGTIPGSDPELSADTIVLQAYYDGTSVVPGLAPSSEASASIVGLIELARYLQRERPSRTVIFLATSAHFQGQQGIVDFIQRHARRHSTYAERLTEPLDIDLFVSLDLSTGTDQLGVWDNTFGRRDYRTKLTRFFAPIARVFVEEAEITAGRQGRNPATALVNGVSPIKGFTWGSYMPQGLQSDARIALVSGLPSLTIATINDARIVLDTPLDNGSHLHLPNLTRQVELLGPTVQRALAAPQLLATGDELRKAIHDELRNLRIHARSFPRRSQTPDRPVTEALVTMKGSYWITNGVKPTRVYRTDSSGAVEVPGLRLGYWEAAAYAVDPATGAITYAPDFSKRAEAHHGKPVGGYLWFDVRWSDTVDRTIVLFPTMPQEIYSLIHPRSMDKSHGLKIVDANDVAPRQFGYTLTERMNSPAAVLFGAAAPEEKDRLKILLTGMPLLNTSPGIETADHGFGRGYLATEGPLTHTTYGAAVDLWRVDEHRLETMREHAIENAHLQQMHVEAETQIAAAEHSRQALAWDRYIAHARAALGIEGRAYPRILATLNDVIKGVLFFLALLIPAALFGERLLFAASDIRWQLTGFGALMLIIWAVLSLVHPAFDLAHPLVIVLAFSIMAMAAFVIFMVATRFGSYAEQYKSVVARVHTADFSRVGALYVAFMLGVSNMRRRRLRTGLTLATLTLLTFSMLSFTSFEDRIRFVSVPLEHQASREGIMLRTPTWHELESTLLDYVGSHFGRSGVITPRSWYRSSVDDAVESISVSAGEDRHTTAIDMVGLMPAEDEVTRFSNTLIAGSFFQHADEQTCLLPEKVADALGISAADVGKVSVRVLGSDLLVRGIFHAPAVDELIDLDGGTLMPVDAQLSVFTELETDYDELREVESQAALRSFIHHSAADVLVLPYEVLRGFDGRLRSIGIRFHQGTEGQQLIEDFLSRVNTGLYAGLSVDDFSQPEVYHYRSFGLGSVEGLGALAVPILIASLIILNTMLGAVYERFREIGIYSSVGLAPMHIAFLFIAEACVYAVLGVTLGYVLGQSLGKILLAFDLLQGIDLNYSSSSGIAAALLVMAVVLLSTLYPARIAAQAAVPETVRRWRPPPPDGDQWRFTFPFNVSSSEVVGTCGFLHSYFSSFMGAAAGDIYTEDVHLEVSQDDSPQSLHFTQWLSPYDLGVSQRVRIAFGATETPGLYTIDILIDRISGESFHWRRLNPRFFSMLRKQLLIWNALGQEARQEHAARALEVLEDQEVAAAAALDIDEQPADAAPQDSAVSSREATGKRKSPFSMRGLLLGTVLSFIIGSGVTYGALVLQGSWLQNNASSPSAIFLFFGVTAILNVILGAVRQRFALSRADLVLIYVMMLMAVTVPNQGFVGYVLPIITASFYYATVQNEWGSYFTQHFPEWIVPQDPDVITHLYEGLPPGAAIPWGTWAGPLAYWTLLFFALAGVMVCMSVILHRQWSVHERLEYPMAQVPLQMIERSQGPMAQISPLYRNKWTWIGFAVPAIVLSLNGLNHHFPSVPEIYLNSGYLTFLGGTMVLSIGIVPAWVGLSFLVNLDISLSVWVFYLLTKLQDSAFATLGVAPTERLSAYNWMTTSDQCHQAMGACVVFVLFGLWVARHHLRDVLRKAWRPSEGIDDSEELISYRTAVVGFIVSLSIVAVWLWKSGMPAWIVPMFLAICLVFYIMITRVIAAAGVATARSPMIAAFVLVSGLGGTTIGASGLVAMSFTYVWQAEMRLFPMIACANGLKLAETVRGPKRRLVWAIVLALVASLVGAGWVFMQASYTHGSLNLSPFFAGFGKRPFTDLLPVIRDMKGPDLRGWGFTAIGATVESFLIYAQHHLHWWRIHPVGFIIGSGWLTGQMWFSVFLAWSSKLIIMKYGGMTRFIAAKPFFIGLILGEATTAGVWLIIDYLSGGVGNVLSTM